MSAPSPATTNDVPNTSSGDPTKRALLIGSAYGGLSGVSTDIATMKQLLQVRQFSIRDIQGPEATREGILAAWKQVIEDSKKDNVVVVYYSGHGGLAETTKKERRQPWRFQFIVPIDFDKSSDDDFRGIADVELSHLLRDLTEKTKNVTVILDCCHSALMARLPDATPKALSRTSHKGVDKHVDKLRASGQLQGFTFVESNPYAVRVVAAATTESAYEYTNSQGKRIGVLTESLHVAVQAGSDNVTWKSVMNRIHDRVALTFPQQHPLVEGPANRKLFSSQTVNIEGMLNVKMSNGHAQLEGGRIAGVEEGDVYRVMPGDEPIPNPETQIATATVKHVESATASVSLEYSDNYNQIPEGAQAFPISKARIRWAIHLEGDDEFTDRIRSRLVTSKLVRLFGDNEEDPPLMTGKQVGDRFTLLDSQQVRLFAWQLEDNNSRDNTVREIVDRVETLSRAQHLLRLEGGIGQTALKCAVDIEWGVVEGGQRSPLPAQGTSLRAGQRVYVSICNNGESTVYVSLYDIGITGNITLLSRGSPKGTEIPAKRTYLYGGRDHDGATIGGTLSWPNSVATDFNGYEAIAIVITSGQLDLTSMETDTLRRGGAPRGNEGPELLRIVDQISYGGVRELAPNYAEQEIKYDIQHIRFVLNPNDMA